MSATRQAIADLRRAGVSAPEIARRLCLAPTTVSYHVERLAEPRASREPVAPLPAAAVKPRTRDRVAELLAEGVPRAEIARRLHIAKQTVTYHAQRLGNESNHRFAQRYDWAAVQMYYDAGHGVRACMRVFGFSSSAWHEAVRRGAVRARQTAMPISQLLVAGTFRNRYHLKARIIKEGLKAHRCERCGISEWRGAPLSVALHHVNGDRLDNRLENLELLCPNCHSQTDTYSGRNGHRRRRRLPDAS